MRYDLQCWTEEGRLTYRARERTQLGCRWTLSRLLQVDQPFVLGVIRVVRRGSLRPGQVRAWLVDPETQCWSVDVMEPVQPLLWEVACG